MDSSASDSGKEIAYISNFSKLSQKKKKHTHTHKKMIIILVNILLHICFITFLKFKGKSNSKYANALKTVMGLVAVAVMQKNE